MMTEPERWGVWITQGSTRKNGLPTSYWWQGPNYYGDMVMTRLEAEAAAKAMQAKWPGWTYEARLYVQKAG
jgi:hypothetical protein